MKITINTPTEVEAKYLQVQAGMRHFEDAEVNGIEDNEGKLMPFIVGELWCPKIDIDNGQIVDWPKGTTASVHYKVCDSGNYYVTDESGNELLKIEDDYVPKILCPKENGYGDYIIMDINENGMIADWNPSLEDFTSEED